MTKATTKNEPAPTNGFTPVRGTGATSIPDIVRKPSADLSIWQSEVEYLKTDMLGSAQDYPDVPDVANLASKLRKNLGIEAVSRNTDNDKDSPKKGYGTLWLKYPVKIVKGDDDQDYYEADEMAVARNIEENKS